jgi:hypothetical protein
MPRWPDIKLTTYPLGVEFVLVVNFADGRVLPLNGRYFTDPNWWFITLTRPLGNDNPDSSAEPEPFPNIAPCAWPADLISLFDRPVRGTVNGNGL